MDFINQWRQEIPHTLAKSAALAAEIDSVDLEYALMAAGVLWPLREPVQEFDLAAIEAVSELLGPQASLVLKQVQGWGDDLGQAAHRLNTEIAANPELEAAIKRLLKEFKALFIFTEALAAAQPAGAPASLSSTPSGIALTPVPPAEAAEAPPPRVFISYARSDGEALARDLRQRLEQEKIPVWQDRVKMEGGRDWWLQITEALNQVEFMVLITTPAALRSEVVRKEWRYARQQGVCVYPIQGGPPLDSASLPRWIRHLHFYDPEQEWDQLVAALDQPCQTPRVPFMIDKLPEDFVPRQTQIEQATGLLVDEQGDPIPGVVALHGAGGYGKTLLARALCHQEKMQQAFDDGVLWVTLGENPTNLTERVIDLVEMLSGERPGFAGLDEAETRLTHLLADRNILLVLDDVWNIAHLRPFMQGGPRCARLITTRNVTALPPDAQATEVGTMARNEAVQLLKTGLSAEGPRRTFENLAARLGEWPLLLKLANSTLRDRVHNNNQALEAALAYVNRALDKRGLTAFDAHNAAARDQAVSQTLGISQELLTDSERAHYGDLAIFPGGVNIPLTILKRLWPGPAEKAGVEVEAFCQRLFELSLLNHFDPDEGYIVLHNIVQKYLAQKQKAQLPQLHHKLLQAHAPLVNQAGKRGSPWATLPPQETYLWRYLAHHLAGANRLKELAATVKDLLYLATKTHLRSAYAAEADMLLAQRALPQDRELARLHQAFSQASHLLNQGKTLDEIANTLHSRLLHTPGLANALAASQTPLPRPLLTAYRRLPDLPDSSLIRTLTGHGLPVLACALDAEGATLVSMDRDGTLKIWDVATGAELFTLTGHAVMGSGCAINAEGAVVASGSWDGLLKIWDSRTGRERHSLEAHSSSIFACALSADGSTLVTASKDRTLKVWDVASGAERFTLSGHERAVTGCDISPDGTVIISSSPDGTLKLWEGQTGALRLTLEAVEISEKVNPVADLTFASASSAILACALSADGQQAVSSLPDGRLKVWDLTAGRLRQTLKGHTGWVQDCRISADGSLVISVSNDKTIRGWDAATGEEQFRLEGHNRTVTGCALSRDSKLIATASQDKTVKLWDVDGITTQPAQTRHITPAHCCAVTQDGAHVLFDVPGNGLKFLETKTCLDFTLLQGHKRPLSGCAVSVAGAIIVTASQDRTVKVWNLFNGRERLTLEGHTWAVNDCAVSQDGGVIVSVSEDSTVKVWDPYTGAERHSLTGHERGVNSCALPPDASFIVSASADKTLKLWDLASGQARLTLTGHSGPVNSCAIGPAGRLIASASSDNTLKLWDSQTGQERHTLIGHTTLVTGCDFSPDGRYLASVSKDNTVKLWAVETGRCASTLRLDGGLLDCAWFPDGVRLVVAGARGTYFLQMVE